MHHNIVHFYSLRTFREFMSHTKLNLVSTYSICKRSCESNLSFCFDDELFPLNLVVFKRAVRLTIIKHCKIFSLSSQFRGSSSWKLIRCSYKTRQEDRERSPALRNPLRLSAPSMFNSCWSPHPLPLHTSQLALKRTASRWKESF